MLWLVLSRGARRIQQRSAKFFVPTLMRKETSKHPRNPACTFVFASGRAGNNEAIWEAEIAVEPGTEATVKLASPKQACSVAR